MTREEKIQSFRVLLGHLVTVAKASGAAEATVADSEVQAMLTKASDKAVDDLAAVFGAALVES